MRKIAVALLISAVLVMLSGCSIFTMETEQLLAPPALTGDMAPVQKALNDSVKGEYTLMYPSGGEYRSSVIFNDIDGDGKFEVFAFYSQLDGDINYTHLNVIRFADKKWCSIADEKIAAGGVDRVDFADLSNDGVLEIIVGWEIYGSSEKQLTVYSVKDNAASQRLMHEYTSFLCCDLDQDGSDELFIHSFNLASSANTAFLYTLEKGGALQLSSCIMDKAVRSVAAPVLSQLSNGQPAIYIDETKATGNITEVLFVQKGALVNPLIDPELLENVRTLSMSDASIADINGDGIIEIPVSEELVSSANGQAAQKAYYTKWCSYDGNSLMNRQTTLLNTAYGYYISVPDKWIGKIALVRDNDAQGVTIYAFDAQENRAGAPIAYFSAVALDRWEEIKDSTKEIVEISRNSTYVFAGRVYSGDNPLCITEQELKGMFFLY